MARTNEQKLAVLSTLDKAHWIEIFNTLPVRSDAYRAMKPDTRIETEGMKPAEIQAMVKYARVIYHAVWQKLNPWLYDDRKWRSQMVELLDTLEPFAYCEMCGAEPGQPHHQPHKGNLKPVTLHRWQSADDKYHRLCMSCRAGARQIPNALTVKEIIGGTVPSDLQPEDTEDILATLKDVTQLQGDFLNAIFRLEALTGIETIDPAIDFRKVTMEQLVAQALPANVVYTLLVSYPDGNDVWVFTTEDAALERLAQYCRDNWDGLDELGPEDPPELDEAVIAAYFFDGRENESWDISPAVIQGPIIAQQPLPEAEVLTAVTI